MNNKTTIQLPDLSVWNSSGRILNMLREKQERPKRLERAYFAQFAGDTIRRVRCQNCHAEYLTVATYDPRVGNICCAHCMFNPLGCRCKYGEFGVEETYQDDFYPLDME